MSAHEPVKRMLDELEARVYAPVLEGPGIEALLPIIDRVLMIKVTEEDRYV